MIDPTIGRIVWFHNRESRERPGSAPFPAIVTFVHDARCVDLTIFGENNHPSRFCGAVKLVQPEDGPTEAFERGESFCQWMPYQVKKPTGSESGEKEAGEVTV